MFPFCYILAVVQQAQGFCEIGARSAKFEH
jgi:hypothetical protein